MSEHYFESTSEPQRFLFHERPLATKSVLSTSAFFLLRDLRAGFASFGQADRDRLLPALHLLTRAAFERAMLHFVHDAFHLVASTFLVETIGDWQ